MMIKRNNYTKNGLRELIVASSLSDSEKNLWFYFIDNIILKKEEVVAMLKTLQVNDNTLNFLTKNLQDKITAMKNNDKLVWQEIIQVEKKYLESNS